MGLIPQPSRHVGLLTCKSKSSFRELLRCCIPQYAYTSSIKPRTIDLKTLRFLNTRFALWNKAVSYYVHTPQSCFCLCIFSATVSRVAAVHLFLLGRSWLGHAYKLDALRTGCYPVWRWAAIRSGSEWTVDHRDCPGGEAVTRLWPTAPVQSRRPNTAPSHFPKEARNQDSFHAGNKCKILRTAMRAKHNMSAG